MRSRIIKVACMKFSQQRIAIKTAKVNDEISPTSICCNSHFLEPQREDYNRFY